MNIKLIKVGLVNKVVVVEEEAKKVGSCPCILSWNELAKRKHPFRPGDEAKAKTNTICLSLYLTFPRSL